MTVPIFENNGPDSVSLSSTVAWFLTLHCVTQMYVPQVAEALVGAAQRLDLDPAVRVMIVTGEGHKAFAAGADVKELAERSYSSVRLFLPYDQCAGACLQASLLACRNS